MHAVLHIAALIWFLGGVWAFATGASGWHLMIGFMLVSFAVTFLGIGWLIEVMNKRAADAKRALGLLAG